MDRFEPVVLSESQQHYVEEVREAFRRVESSVLNLTASSREQSLALTKLEEACMWAVRAIAVEVDRS